MSEFNFQKLRAIYDAEKLKAFKEDNKHSKFDKTKKYVQEHFVPTTSATHILVEGQSTTIIQQDTFKQVYLNRFPDEIIKWYVKETIPKKIICELHKPLLTESEINISPQLKHKYQKYNKFDDNIKSSVNVFLEYVKIIWANNNEKVYQYLLKWLANMIKGNKNRTCIFAKGPEGIGKSTLIDILFDYVIGVSLCCKGKADHLKSQHNMQLLGKIFVPFEELQFFSDKEWSGVDSELKDLITGDYASYTDKYEKRFDAKNTNNYIINSNFNAIKGANGRRYLVADINTSYQNDHKFFANIRKHCFNDATGHAIYCYLCEINTDNFNSLDLPETQNKLDLIVDLMTPVEKFLKNAYILQNRSLKGKPIDIYNTYVEYCTDNKFSHKTSIQLFCKNLREYGIDFKTTKHGNVYDVPFEPLKELAKRKKWLHHLDSEVASDNESKNNKIEDDDPLEHGIVKSITKHKENLSIEEQIKQMEAKLKQLYNQQLEQSTKLMEVKGIIPPTIKSDSVLSIKSSEFIMEF
ncbi:MAG: hypothetical protein JSS98_06175 [Bacteroidetes bacterium]|nr:hypothetical protein [Bacteroidota bacterium]